MGWRPAFLAAALVVGTAAAATGGPDAMPRAEQDYIKAIADARTQFEAARSDAARKGARAGLQIRLHALLGLNHRASDWIGRLRNSGKLFDGRRWVEIEIAPDVTIATWRTDQLDGQYATLLQPGSALAHAVDSAAVGTTVKFSADLIGGRVGSDEDMVKQPQAIARFTAIAPVR